MMMNETKDHVLLLGIGVAFIIGAILIMVDIFFNLSWVGVLGICIPPWTILLYVFFKVNKKTEG